MFLLADYKLLTLCQLQRQTERAEKSQREKERRRKNRSTEIFFVSSFVFFTLFLAQPKVSPGNEQFTNIRLRECAITPELIIKQFINFLFCFIFAVFGFDSFSSLDFFVVRCSFTGPNKVYFCTTYTHTRRRRAMFKCHFLRVARIHTDSNQK